MDARATMLDQFPDRNPRKQQFDSITFLAEHDGGILEIPTGGGKTHIGVAFDRMRQADDRDGLVLYITPTKAQVDQICTKYTDARPMYGRNEHPCAYYHARGKPMTAAEVPCRTLCSQKLCPHEVNQETGETREPGATPCAYYAQKYAMRQGTGITVATTAFFLTNFSFMREPPQFRGLVVDEAHKIAAIARSIFASEITDYHLRRAIAVLRRIGDREDAAVLFRFLKKLRTLGRSRADRRDRPTTMPKLLSDDQLGDLLVILDAAKPARIAEAARDAIRSGKFDPGEEAATLKLLEDLTRSIPRYMHGLAYAVESEDAKTGAPKRPLNFVFAYHHLGDLNGKHVRHHLVIKGYYVAPLIRRLVGTRALVMSATIGDPTSFGYETGITLPHLESTEAPFPVGRSRLFIPTDTPDLAFAARGQRTLRDALRQVADACATFAQHGHRSLVVVQSNEERVQFTTRARTIGLNAVTYDGADTPKAAAARFKAGEGQVLVGTSANYGEGVDLPDGIAPVIFFLRPGYPSPSDPQTQFEARRFPGGQRFAIAHWRVQIEALQVRGRNIRGARDKGVCFFVSQQFRKIVPNAIPIWLDPALRGGKTLVEGIAEALEILKN